MISLFGHIMKGSESWARETVFIIKYKRVSHNRVKQWGFLRLDGVYYLLKQNSQQLPLSLTDSTDAYAGQDSSSSPTLKALITRSPRPFPGLLNLSSPSMLPVVRLSSFQGGLLSKTGAVEEVGSCGDRCQGGTPSGFYFNFFTHSLHLRLEHQMSSSSYLEIF